MVPPPRRRRATAGRATGRRRNAISRAVRAARNAPLARVRARSTVRGRGSSTAAINALRRLMFFPKRVSKEATPGAPWWLESLKWISSVAMKLLTILLTADGLEAHLKAFPLPLDSPLSGRLLAGSVVSGCIMRLGFGPEDLLGETCFIDTSRTPSHGQYRQAKLEWVKVVINPVSHQSQRAGMIAAVIVACNRDQSREDFAVRLTESYSMKELLATPGVVYKTATTPTTLTYSPRPSEHGYEWLQFGCQSVSTGLYGAGGDICFYLDVAFQNMSSDTAEVEQNYNLANLLLDVSIEARVHLREHEEKVYCRSGPVPFVNSLNASVFDYDHCTEVALSDAVMHHGVLLFEDDRAFESMSE